MKTAYMITCYFGDRRVFHPKYNVDRLLYINLQLDKLSSISHSFDEIFFIFSLDDNHYDLFQLATDIIAQHPTGKNHKVTVVARQNVATSYGAWDFALKETVDDEFDYCLLVEDDYIPFSNNFDEKFISLFKDENILYICQLYSNHIVGRWHCSIANGAIDKRKFDAHYKETGEGFRITHLTTDMKDADWNQVFFLDEMLKRGYVVKDTDLVYQSPFLEPVGLGRIKIYGQKDAEILLAPAFPPYFE